MVNWEQGYFPPPGTPWTTGDHDKLRTLYAENSRLIAEINRLKDGLFKIEDAVELFGEHID